MIKTSRAGNEGAFSLLELLLVLSLLGLSAYLVLPSLDRGIEAIRVKKTALGLAAVARNLRARALNEQRPFRLIVDASQDRYHVYGGEEFLLPEGVHVATMDGGEPLNGDLTQFVFFPNGRLLGGEIEISGGRGKSYRIQLDRLSGKVVVSTKRDL